MKLFILLLVLLAVSLTCAKKRKRAVAEAVAEPDEEDTQDNISYLEVGTEVNLAQQTTRAHQQGTGAEEQTPKVPEQTTGVPEPTTDETEQIPVEPQQTTEAPEQTTEAPEQTTEAPEQTTATPEQTTATPEQTTATPEQTTATPEQTTPTPEQTTATPEQTTATPEQTTATPEQTSNSEPATEQVSIDPAVQSTEPTTDMTSLNTGPPAMPTTLSMPTTESTRVTPEPTTKTPEVPTQSGQTTEDEPEAGLERAEAVVNASIGKPGGRPYGMTTARYGFQVGLFINDGKKFCGGALLDEDWVITAASCLPPNSKVIAVLGLQYRYLNNASKNKSQIHLVDTYTIHEEYQARARKNDIALIKLTRSAKIDNEFIKTIRLPKQSQKLPVGLRATYPGFGKTYTGKVSPFLREARSTLLPKSYCRLRYLFSTVHDANVCLSGILATRFCKGDVGGPLLLYETDLEPTLIGINSYVGGLGCSLTWPTVFTKVSPYVSWINRVTGIPIRT